VLIHSFGLVTAAVGLSLATAPDVAHYIPFLRPLVNGSTIAAGVATVLAPAVAVTLFILLGLALIHCRLLLHPF